MKNVIVPKVPLLAPPVARRIVRQNKEEKIWLGTELHNWEATTNISRHTIKGVSHHEKWGEKELPDVLVRRMFKAVKFYPNLFFYVHNSAYGFYPVFTFSCGAPVLTAVHLMKWTKGMMDEKLYKEMLKILYSNVNKVKHLAFGLSSIKEISHYEY